MAPQKRDTSKLKIWIWVIATLIILFLFIFSMFHLPQRGHEVYEEDLVQTSMPAFNHQDLYRATFFSNINGTRPF